MTPQQIADQALAEHQAKRRAIKRGDVLAMLGHELELARLCVAFKESI